MDDKFNCYFTFFSEAGDLSQPNSLGNCMDLQGLQSISFNFVPYFINNNQLYMKKGDKQFNVIDIQAIKNNDQQNFIHEVKLVQQNVNCQSINVFQQANKFFLFCDFLDAKGYRYIYLFQDTTLDNVLASNNIETKNCQGRFLSPSFNYAYSCDILIYKGKKIDTLGFNRPIMVDEEFDLFILNRPNLSDQVLCKLDINQIQLTCKQQIKFLYQTFFSQVVQSNNMNLIIYTDYYTFIFLNVDTFTPLITSPKMQKTYISNLSHAVLLYNTIILQDDNLLLKFKYNPGSMEVELKYLQSDFLSVDNYNIYSSGVQPNMLYYSQFQKGNLFVQYKYICNIFNINQVIPLCTDYCAQCGSTNYEVCQKCQNGYYLQINNTCALTCPAFAKQDSINFKCQCSSNQIKVNNECQCNDQYYLNGDQCFPCPSNCQKCSDQHTCENCLPLFYLFPDLTCGYCDTKNGYFINEEYCLVCDKQCKTCYGASQDQCSSCYEGYGLNKNTCQQTYLVYEANIFTESRIIQIKELSETSSSTVVASTFVMSLLQNIGSNSSFGILVSGLTIQNLVYLYLFNANIPKPIYSALQTLSGKLPSQQLLFLNPFSKLIDEKKLQYQNANLCEQSNISEYVQSIENLSLTFLISLQIVQLISPFYMLLTVSIQIYDSVRKKMKEKCSQQQEQELDLIMNSLQINSSINIELTYKKMEIVDIFKKNKKQTENNQHESEIKNN
ncbi:hypothetical protein ABPG74_015740 [Tetrahymena malaccensis]